MFHLKAGIYRRQSIEPKDRQRFVGRPGAVLNGAMLVSGWQRRDLLWVAPGPARRFRQSGSCLDETDLCKRREDLFVDGKLYRRVGSIATVGPGSWHDDGAFLFVTDDPTGKTVELSVTPAAFNGKAHGVRLETLTVEKYPSRAARRD